MQIDPNYYNNINLFGLTQDGGSIDNDPVFMKLCNALYEAVKEFKNTQNPITTQWVMQCVTNLDTYLKGKTPDPDSSKDQNAKALIAALGSGPNSLAGMCADPKDWESTIQANPDIFDTIYNAADNESWSISDQSDSKTAADLKQFYQDLQGYLQNPSRASQYLSWLAGDITNLVTDGANDKDGPISALLNLLQTNTTVGGTDTLASLAKAVASGGDPTKFAAALQSLSEGGQNCGILLDLIKTCSQQENWPIS